MNVSLPDKLKDWVESQVAEGFYSNTSDFIRDILRREQERQAKIAHMQALVDEGIKSGVSEKSVDDIWQEALDKWRTA